MSNSLGQQATLWARHKSNLFVDFEGNEIRAYCGGCKELIVVTDNKSKDERHNSSARIYIYKTRNYAGQLFWYLEFIS